MVCIIAAIGEGGVIGSEKGLPWDIPEEYNQFLNQVRGETIIMGRKSWEIFKGDLKDTRFIVVSRNPSELIGADKASGIKEALSIAKTYKEKIFIAGGGQIYRDGIKFSDRMHLSYIKGKHSGNVFFPAFNQDNWTIVKTEDHPNFIYREFVRKKD